MYHGGHLQQESLHDARSTKCKKMSLKKDKKTMHHNCNDYIISIKRRHHLSVCKWQVLKLFARLHYTQMAGMRVVQRVARIGFYCMLLIPWRSRYSGMYTFSLILTGGFRVQVILIQAVMSEIPGCWKVLSPTYFPMYFVWWWECFFWC